MGARTGDPAPWAGLAPSLRGITVDGVRAAVEAVCRTGEPEPSPAAVLLAVFEETGEARIVLIRRTMAVPAHPGEIALPGGRVHPGESMVDAALRETHEEVGIPPDAVEVVGWLDRVVGRSSGSVATPVVGLLAGRPPVVTDPFEVEDAFDVALADLLVDGVYREERWDTPVARDRPVYFFELPEATVWGMTARVLRQLLVLVTGVTGITGVTGVTGVIGRRGLPPPAPRPGREGTTPPAPA